MKISIKQNFRIVLASSSATRRKMLEGVGLSFEVEPASIDETALLAALKGEAPLGAQAERLASAKAAAVSARRADDRDVVVIGSDQILEFDGEAYEAPRSREEAESRLRLLQGRDHRLIAGVAVMRGPSLLGATHQSVTVSMRRISDAELSLYLERAGPDALRTVGAYELEGLGARLFERIDGDWFAALGLPLLPLLAMLRQIEEDAAPADPNASR